MAISTYLVDAFGVFAASAVAASTVLRSLGGAVLPLAGGKMFETLANEGVNIEMISTSEIKISVVVDLAKGEQAMKAVHAAFLPA